MVAIDITVLFKIYENELLYRLCRGLEFYMKDWVLMKHREVNTVDKSLSLTGWVDILWVFPSQNLLASR